MRRLAILTLSLVLLAPSMIQAQEAYDADATATLEAYVDAMFVAMNEGNYEVVYSSSDDTSIFDLSEEGLPITLYGMADWNARLDALLAQVEAMGIASEYTMTRRDCHANQTLGFCAIEYDTTVEVEGVSFTLQWRMTLVTRLEEGAWSWVHMHNSFRNLPGTEEPVPSEP